MAYDSVGICIVMGDTSNTMYPPAIEVIASTWSRESHDLYDYESRYCVGIHNSR